MSRIFIGSSSEGLLYANKIAKALQKDFAVQIWNKDSFQNNESNLHSLEQQAYLSDFGVFVATKDDLTQKRNILDFAIRDNVLFEFGLFIGTLGKRKVFLLVDKDVVLPSDLSGITVFPVNFTDEKSLKLCSQRVKKEILSMEKSIGPSILPSTAIAIGYFDNFLKPTIKGLLKIPHTYEGRTINELLQVRLPKSLPGDLNEYILNYNIVNAGKNSSIKSETRNYELFVNILTDDVSERLTPYDIPATISSIGKVIDLCLKTGFLNKDDNYRILENRELENFSYTLKYLIGSDPITKGRIEVSWID